MKKKSSLSRLQPHASQAPDIKIGILAFQGDIEEHEAAVASLGYHSYWIRTKEELQDITHLILPGGESTTMGKLLVSTGIGNEIQKRVRAKTLQVYGTCAGAILLAKNVETNIPVNNLPLMDITISRNAYGSQIHSFSTELQFLLTKKKFEGVFIRAPKIMQWGKNVKILCRCQEQIVAAEQENMLISTFHPELIRPALFHAYFLQKRLKE